MEVAYVEYTMTVLSPVFARFGKLILLSGATVCLANCAAEPTGVKQPKSVEIVAHRGASEDAPENTIAAFEEAWHQGADAIEGDFRMTRDSVIVCLHDHTLERTTGDPRKIDEVTLEDIRLLDAGSWKADAFASERIPTLQEVFDVVPPGKKILIEIKTGPEIVPVLADTLESCAREDDQITVMSFNRAFVRAFKVACPSIRGYLLEGFKEEGGAWSPTTEELIAEALELGVDGVDVKAIPELVDADFVERCHDAGLEVHVWTVNDSGLASQMEAAGVSSITTNRPGTLRRELGIRDDGTP